MSRTINDRFYGDPGCYDAATLPEEGPKTGANKGSSGLFGIILFTRPPSASRPIGCSTPQNVSSRQTLTFYTSLLFHFPLFYLEFCIFEEWALQNIPKS